MKSIVRSIPGTMEVSGRAFMYVESPPSETFRQIVDAAFKADSNLPLPKAGGVIEEKVRVCLNDGTLLLGLSYKGDIEGWQNKLVGYCKESGRTYGFIKNDQLFLSTGTTLLLENLVFHVE